MRVIIIIIKIYWNYNKYDYNKHLTESIKIKLFNSTCQLFIKNHW